MIIRISWRLCAAGMVLATLLACNAFGQELPLYYAPPNEQWDLGGQNALHGKVETIVEDFRGYDWQKHEAMKKPMSSNKLTFQEGRLVSVASIPPEGMKITNKIMIKYQDGRKQEVAGTSTMDDKAVVDSFSETATYKPNGELDAITCVKYRGDKVNLPFLTEATSDGGKKISWSLHEDGPAGQSVNATQALVFDKSGRLLRVEMSRGQVPAPTRSIAYNSHGDIESITNYPHPGLKTIYEREYDPQGNWIKATESTTHQHGDKEVKDDAAVAYERKIKYAP